ncbi:MAG: hydrolase [Hyphomicrobiales bacterium]|nr:hydrolase [Hyphomicrobiales bacterium]MCP5372824.1 hydrolase [Hyphomicrobiales bacterium]
MRMTAADSCLLVVDIQQRLLPAMAEPDAVTGQAAVLLRAARRLEVPVLVSEQYPRGLGPTVESVAALAPDGATVEKTHFSCWGEPDWRWRFQGLGRRQAVVCGIEAHVCVLQTVLDLLDAGHAVFVVADATSSRRAESKQRALARLAAAGAAVVTTEMVLFEWLQRADVPAFRELSALIK